MTRRYGVILLLGFVVLAGCAEPGSAPSASSTNSSEASVSDPPEDTMSPSPDPDASPAPESSPPSSSTPPPSLGAPTVGPQKPTDLVGSYWVSGTVTRGGGGPCYGLLTDDGIDFALYSRAGDELVDGEQLRVRVRAASFRVDCGSGQLMSLYEIERG